ncbi:hypothetical protein [Herbiconiux sp. L3-i23]|uniref:hypothetical protein n=1 Tax=Herbiconiux sp. L3-i23 TaxID=2905871 RepID=UPI00206B486C|nr:hypothetical protein [Herbiconiux sp. L3-i23]BDI22251.1 hypothetical protein L3i23_10270 [Herbiconiux sp. L3-i23]
MIPVHPVLAVLYWIALILTLAGTAAVAVLAWRRASAVLVYGATGGLGLALLLAWVPIEGAGFAVQALITILALVVAVAGGGPAAALALGFASKGSVRDGEHGGIIRGADEVLRGGTAIGLLERLAVAGTLLAGFPEGLAVIVAVKGVGRFSELDDSATRERFIIGSLVSLIWACAATGVALLARG